MPETLVQPPKASPQATPTVSTPKETTSVQQPISQVETKDLLKRVSEVKDVKKEPLNVSSDMPKVSISVDDIKDPLSKQILEKKLEEANKGISEAFGKVGAEKSKYLNEIDTLKKQLEAQTNKRYTTADIQAMLQRQDFIQAATDLQASIAPQGVPQETWSSWTPEEKQAFQLQRQKTDALEQQVMQMQQFQVMSQVDSELKQEYPDYDSNQINEFYQKAYNNQMSPKEIRKAVYLATNAEKLINRAYELGKQDGKSNIQEKLSGISPNGLNITPTTTNSLEKKPGERSSVIFSQHAHRVLEMLRTMPKKT